MSENTLKVVQYNNVSATDSASVVETFVNLDDGNLVLYTKPNSMENKMYSTNNEKDNEVTKFVMGYEYVSIFLIIILVCSLCKHYGKLMSKVFNTLGSYYLVSRYLDNISLAIAQMYFFISTIVIISGAFLMFRIVPDTFFYNMPLLVEFKIPIFILAITLLLFINSFLFKFTRIFLSRRWDVVKKVVILSKTHTLFHVIILLVALLISYIYPNNNYFASQVIALGGLFLVFLYTFFTSTIYFYNKNVSFIQYILYFCIVKVGGVCFFGYYLLRTINYI